MEEVPLQIWLFILGTLSSSIFFLRSKRDIRNAGIALVGSLLIAARLDEAFGEGMSGFLISCIVGYVGIFSILSKDTVLSIINERVLLQLSVLYVYVTVVHYSNTIFWNLWLVVVCIPLIIAIYLAFKTLYLSDTAKLLSYIWFLILNVLLILAFFPNGNPLRIGEFIVNTHEYTALITGTTFFYLVSNISFLYMLIPFKGKHQSWEERMREWHELTHVMKTKHDELQTHHYMTVGILVIQGGVLAGNYFFNIVSHIDMITIVLFSSQLLSMFEDEFIRKYQLKFERSTVEITS